MERRPDGHIRVRLRTAWHDGTTHLVFEPLEFLEQFAALTPRPEINVLIYHGVRAPHAGWRRRVVRYGGAATGATLEPAGRGVGVAGPEAGGAVAAPHAWTWAALMRRASESDALACPRCGGRLRLIATVDDPAII